MIGKQCSLRIMSEIKLTEHGEIISRVIDEECRFSSNLKIQRSGHWRVLIWRTSSPLIRQWGVERTAGCTLTLRYVNLVPGILYKHFASHVRLANLTHLLKIAGDLWQAV